jgi:hypothetical protein
MTGFEDGLNVADAMDYLEMRGYRAQFTPAKDGKVHCSACGHDREPEKVTLVALGRVEGASDPADESAVAALRCACGALGTQTFGFGASADPVEMRLFRHLHDGRAGFEHHRAASPA